MHQPSVRYLAALTAASVAAIVASGAISHSSSGRSMTPTRPALDSELATVGEDRTAVFAGGCFWGIEAVFEHVKGVKQVVSGYAGGTRETASYDEVSSGSTGHAEAVRITYDPSQVTYGTLLSIFFSVAHDPTQLNRQGPDVGPQYRSAIFFGNEEEKRVAEAYVAQLTAAKTFSRPIVTQIVALEKFYDAEAYHQDYAARNPNQPYIVIHDAPKVVNLRKHFPKLFREPLNAGR